MTMRPLRSSSSAFSTWVFFFFFNDTATTEIYTLSLHDALPIYPPRPEPDAPIGAGRDGRHVDLRGCGAGRSEEHTSELQSRLHLVCRLLLEKKKTPLRLSGAHQQAHRSCQQGTYVSGEHHNLRH